MKISYSGWSKLPLLLLTTFLHTHPVLGQEPSPPFLLNCNHHPDPVLCTAETLSRHINKELIYPSLAIESLVEGTVLLGFTIDTSGNVKDLKVLKDIGGGCGLAALSAFPAKEAWGPAILEGRAVPMDMTLPVKFSLKDTLLTAANAYTIYWGNQSEQTHIKQGELKTLMTQSPVLRNKNGDVIQPVELYYIKLILTRKGRSKIKKFRTRDALFKHLKPDHRMIVVGIVPYKRTFLEVTKEWIITR